MSKKSKKAKKDNKPRPIFICTKCHAYWVSDFEYVCWHCGIAGEPQNESAVRMMRWRMDKDERSN